MRGKPLILSRKPGSNVRAAKKRASEAAFESGKLPKNPPAELRDAPAGRAAWRALMRAHAQLPGELFNGLDRNFLVGYCLAVQARQRALDLEQQLFEKFTANEADLESLLSVRKEARMATRLVADLEKQIYATPKSRGGVTPPARPETPAEVVARELADLEGL